MRAGVTAALGTVNCLRPLAFYDDVRDIVWECRKQARAAVRPHALCSTLSSLYEWNMTPV